MFKQAIFFTFLLITWQASAQNCAVSLIYKQGTTLQYQTFSKSNKLKYQATHQVNKIETLPDRELVYFKCGQYSPNQTLIHSFDYFLACKDDKMIIDRDIMADPKDLVLFQNKAFAYEGKNLHYPTNLHIGDTLRAASYTVTVTSGPLYFATVETSIENRKVIDKVKITVPAGTFDAYKISYVNVFSRKSKTHTITTKTKMVEYIVPGLGCVRSEKVNKKGKVLSYTVLSAMQNGV